MKNSSFLPTTKQELLALGWKELDVIIVTGDAYVDHPSFAMAIVGRHLESLGLRVGIIAQPNWKDTGDFMKLGKPRLFFGVSAGNVDSMVSLYTAARKIRTDDPYSEGGLAGNKPYLPSIIYTNRIKQAFKDVPVIIGGIEASLRRVSHYDYYQDKVRQSILLDAKADLLVYGNGEKPLEEIVGALRKGNNFKEIASIRGTAVPVNKSEREIFLSQSHIALPKHEVAISKKNEFSQMTKVLSENINPHNAKSLYQESGTRGVWINPPAHSLKSQELDRIYNLPFLRRPHTQYKKKVPAFEMIETSITSHRGCYGGCHFCAIGQHQGKFIQSRSENSILNEAVIVGKHQDNKRTVITDIGGPSANMYQTFGRNIEICKKCKRTSCLVPGICSNLSVSQKKYGELINKVESLDDIKSVYINSGIRYDLGLCDEEFVWSLVKSHTQGHLSVAPEHISSRVIRLAGKQENGSYKKFQELFRKMSKKLKKKYYMMPYFIIGLPGDTEETQKQLRKYFRVNNVRMKQVQEFYPTPMTISTSMFHTGLNPFTGEEVQVERKISVKRKWKQKLLNLQK